MNFDWMACLSVPGGQLPAVSTTWCRKVGGSKNSHKSGRSIIQSRWTVAVEQPTYPSMILDSELTFLEFRRLLKKHLFSRGPRRPVTVASWTTSTIIYEDSMVAFRALYDVLIYWLTTGAKNQRREEGKERNTGMIEMPRAWCSTQTSATSNVEQVTQTNSAV